MKLNKSILLFIILILIPTMTLFAHGDDDDGDDVPATEVLSEIEIISEALSDDTEARIENEAASNELELSSLDILAISVGIAVVATGGAWYFVSNHGYSWLDHSLYALIITTGVIHLLVGMQGDLLLLLNGLGYIGLAGLRLLPMARKKPYSNFLNGTIILYTLITIFGYFATHLDHFDTIGLVTKGVEILLIVVLSVLVYRSNRTTALVQN